MKQFFKIFVILSLVICIGLLLFPLETIAAPQNCQVKTYALLTSGWVTRLVDSTYTYEVDLQADWYKGKPTVHIAINGDYKGEFYMPFDLGPIEAVHELDFVYDTGNDGRLTLVQKVVPKVKACNNWSKVPNVREGDSAISKKD